MARVNSVSDTVAKIAVFAYFIIIVVTITTATTRSVTATATFALAFTLSILSFALAMTAEVHGNTICISNEFFILSLCSSVIPFCKISSNVRES